MMDDVDNDLEELAACCREIYCVAMRQYQQNQRGRTSNYGTQAIPQWDGGERPSDGALYKPVWPVLAAFVRKHHLDPELLVRVCFRAREGGPPPTPVNCYGAKALALYKERAAHTEVHDREALVRLLAGQAEVLACHLENRRGPGWTAEDIARSVLGDLSLPLSALFRYCVAERAGYGDLARTFWPMARDQYQRQRALYDEAWGPVLPERLSRAR